MRNKKYCLIKILLIILIFVSFGCKTNRNEAVNSILTESNPFQSLIDNVVCLNDSVTGIILHIESPDLNISWTGTAGVDQIGTNSKLKTNQPFRIASITKTYVATAILLLNEQGKLSLDDRIEKYISNEHLKLLQQEGYETEKIFIRNLLIHTAGIFDYATSDDYFRKINENPQHRWTRTEQLKGAMNWGEPTGLPGEKFLYSDTGYILLGEIIESITEKTLAQSLRELIGFEKLGLNSTWMESIETKPVEIPNIVHPYYNGIDFYDIDPSIDLHGGGGLVSTAADIAQFFQSLYENRIFEKTSTLDTMLTRIEFSNVNKPNQDYRIGIQVENVNGIVIFYHTGLWGTLVTYIPEFKTSIAINFTNEYNPEILVKSLSILEKLNLKRNNN